jgi:hypothetical protein
MEWICGIFSSEVAAAWVQTVGSIVALGVAIRAPIWHATVIEKRRVRDQIKVVVAIAQKARASIKHVVDMAVAEPNYVAQDGLTQSTSGLLAQLRAIPLLDLGDHRVALPILNIATEMDAMMDRVAALRRSTTFEGIPTALIMDGSAALAETDAAIGAIRGVLAEYR